LRKRHIVPVIDLVAYDASVGGVSSHTTLLDQSGRMPKVKGASLPLTKVLLLIDDGQRAGDLVLILVTTETVESDLLVAGSMGLLDV